MTTTQKIDKMRASLNAIPESYFRARIEFLQARATEMKAHQARLQAWEKLRTEIDKLELPERSAPL